MNSAPLQNKGTPAAGETDRGSGNTIYNYSTSCSYSQQAMPDATALQTAEIGFISSIHERNPGTENNLATKGIGFSSEFEKKGEPVFSFYPNIKVSTNPEICDIGQLAERILTPYADIPSIIEKVRESANKIIYVPKSGKRAEWEPTPETKQFKKAGSESKANLPYFVNGLFEGGHRHADKFISANSMVIDLDHLRAAGVDPEEAKRKYATHPEIKKSLSLAFSSPSADGLKLLFHTEPLNKENFRKMWRQVAFLIEQIARTEFNWNVKIDRSCKDASRPCYLSYDSNAYYNPNAVPFELDVVIVPDCWDVDSNFLAGDPVVEKMKKEPVDTISTFNDDMRKGKEKKYGPEIVELYIKVLLLLDLSDREVWLLLGSMAKRFDNHKQGPCYESWCKRSKEFPGYIDEADQEKQWESFNGNPGLPKLREIAEAQGIDFNSFMPVSMRKKNESSALCYKKYVQAPDDVVILPSDVGVDHDMGNKGAADTLFAKIKKSKTLFRRGTNLVKINDSGIVDITPEAFCSLIEDYGKPILWKREDGKDVLSSSTCKISQAKILLESMAIELLPEIKLVTAFPILMKTAEGFELLKPGYNSLGCVWVKTSKKPLDMSFDEARKILSDIFEEFDFQSPGDKSRAMAEILTIMLKAGGWIKGFVPIQIAEADQSQAGKGYRQSITFAIYSETPHVITKGKGIGTTDEALSSAFKKGETCIQFDNWRGPLDSEKLESVLTARTETYSCRVAYSKPVDMKVNNRFFFITSNGFSGGEDIANRGSVTRTQKRIGYVYKEYKLNDASTGDLLEYIKDKQEMYLGAVICVVKEWYRLGCPVNKAVKHDFREWAGTLDWIVQNLFGFAPLMEGHEEIQERVKSPTLTFVRALAATICGQGGITNEWTAARLAEFCSERNLTIPGANDKMDERTRQQCIGRALGSLFIKHKSDEADVTETIDCFSIRRKIKWENGNGIKKYEFAVKGGAGTQNNHNK